MLSPTNELLLNFLMSSKHCSNQAVLVIEEDIIIKESASCDEFYIEFGREAIQSIVTEIAKDKKSTVRSVKLQHPMPEEQLVGLSCVDLVFGYHDMGIVTVRPEQTYASLRQKVAVLSNLCENLDRAPISLRLNVRTGLSTAAYVSKAYGALTGISCEEIERFGIAAVGSRVDDADRAMSDIVAMRAVSTLSNCSWPFRIRINGDLVWRQYFVKNQSLDGNTVIMTGHLCDYSKEAADLGLTGPPGIRETESGELELVVLSQPPVSPSSYSQEAAIGSPTASTLTSLDSLSETEYGVQCPLSRYLKRMLMTCLTTSICNVPINGNSPHGELVSIQYPLEDPVSMLEELLLLIDPELQEPLRNAFEACDLTTCSKLLWTFMGAPNPDWLHPSGSGGGFITFSAMVCNVMLSLKLLFCLGLREVDIEFLRLLMTPYCQFASQLGTASEACILINLAHSVLTRISGRYTRLSTLVAAASDSAYKCWDDATVQLGMIWLSMEWAIAQPEFLREPLLNSCVEDICSLIEHYPKSSILKRLHSIALYNLAFSH